MQVMLLHNMMKSRESLEWCSEAIMNNEKIPKSGDIEEYNMGKYQPTKIVYRSPNLKSETRNHYPEKGDHSSPIRKNAERRTMMSPSKGAGGIRKTNMGLVPTSPARSPNRNSRNSPTKGSSSPSKGHENRDVRRHNSLTLYDSVEARAGPLQIYKLPKGQKAVKTQTVNYFD